MRLGNQGFFITDENKKRGRLTRSCDLSLIDQSQPERSPF